MRLNPGTYRVQTKLRYVWRGKSTTKSKTSTVKVTRKTDATSVSTGEYKKIKKGMTLAQVRKIIGGKGHYNYGNLQMESLTYEHTVGVNFAKGRVTDKYKYSHVYDWC